MVSQLSELRFCGAHENRWRVKACTAQPFYVGDGSAALDVAERIASGRRIRRRGKSWTCASRRRGRPRHHETTGLNISVRHLFKMSVEQPSSRFSRIENWAITRAPPDGQARSFE
jgi:hypothetical protein